MFAAWQIPLMLYPVNPSKPLKTKSQIIQLFHRLNEELEN
ncbi:hypothetical protein NIES2104_03910 [Leptolyngbya sp. NIES-2104]|nr:hypothetical protein NIES2104_03910 [Leptolyngbya sp. NIES-2104]